MTSNLVPPVVPKHDLRRSSHAKAPVWLLGAQPSAYMVVADMSNAPFLHRWALLSQWWSKVVGFAPLSVETCAS